MTFSEAKTTKPESGKISEIPRFSFFDTADTPPIHHRYEKREIRYRKPPSRNATKLARIPRFCSLRYDRYAGAPKMTVSGGENRQSGIRKYPEFRDLALFYTIGTPPLRRRSEMAVSEAKTSNPKIAQIPIFCSFRYERYAAAKPSLRK